MLEHLYLFVLLVFVGFFFLLSKFDFKRLWKIKKKEEKKNSRTRLGGQIGREAQTG